MTPRDVHLLLRALAQELVRCGVRHAVTSPGSRNSPLLLALATEPGLRSWSHIDERAAGFFALGVAKATGMPAVLCCTSGTAAANYAPAVHEAREARVPLLVLTADRPPELRDTGAGQTIDQLDLYGRAAKWFVELGLPGADAAGTRWVRRVACRAVWTALDGRPGAVHLNIPLREPLLLDEPLPPEEPFPGRPNGAPWLARVPLHPAGPPLGLPGRRGVVVAGRAERDPAGEEVSAWARAAGWPLLADPLSGARRGEAAIGHYDALLRAEGWIGAHPPDCVLRTGDLPTSKPLRAWLAALTCPQVALDAEGAWHDPAGVVGIVHPGPLAALAPSETAEAGWLGAWRGGDERAGAALRETLAEHELSEPTVAAHLLAALPPEEVLVVASSMPVRDVETFGAVRDEPPRVLSNRGANGIDGTISTAFGVAATGVGTTLLLGDVALLHDLGGLLACRRLGLPLRIVVLDNDGGGIFSFLPGAGGSEVWEEQVATPHGIDLGRVAALFDLPYRRAASRGDLLAGGVVHVRTDRAENLALHRRAWAAAAAAV